MGILAQNGNTKMRFLFATNFVQSFCPTKTSVPLFVIKTTIHKTRSGTVFNTGRSPTSLKITADFFLDWMRVTAAWGSQIHGGGRPEFLRHARNCQALHELFRHHAKSTVRFYRVRRLRLGHFQNITWIKD